MYILLPPSEGKAEVVKGRPVRLDKLTLPELTPFRETVLDALIDLASRPDEAVTALGLSVGQRDEVIRNGGLRGAPAIPAGALYTGVLYDAMDLATLPVEARRLADRSVLIFSGLWGITRLTDRIPAYRCSGTAKIPGPGLLPRYWRSALEPHLGPTMGRRLVLDLRSTGYAGMWKAPAGSSVAVRVLHERVVDGVLGRSVVSHFNKATKGRLVRDLLTAGAASAVPRKKSDLLGVLRELTYTVEETPEGLDVVVTEL